MTDLARRIAVARGDEPADLVVKRRPRALGLHPRVARDRHRRLRRLRRGPRRLRGRGDTRRRRRRTSSPASSTRTCTSSRRSCSSTSSRGSCCRWARPPSSPTRTRSRTSSARDGIHWLLDVCSGLPLDVYFMASSCVPASAFESPRRPLTAGDLQGLLRRRRVIGLAEMMNFPGVIAGDPGRAGEARARRRGRTSTAMRPACSGKALNAYAASGIRSDHEARTVEEGRAAAPRRHVAADPRGVDGAEPRGPAAARAGARPGADGVLHGRPRPGGHRRLRPPQPDGAQGRRGGRRARGRARARLAQPRPLARPRPPRRDRARLPGRSRRARRPRVVRAADACSRRAAQWRRSRRRTCPSG